MEKYNYIPYHTINQILNEQILIENIQPWQNREFERSYYVKIKLDTDFLDKKWLIVLL